MGEFEEAVSWRGQSHIEFVGYGIWKNAKVSIDQMERARQSVSRKIADASVSLFVASGEIWPFQVALIDLVFAGLPESPERACREVVDAMYGEGAVVSWLMFEGAFGDVRDMFSDDWAPQTYCIRSSRDEVFMAVDDDVRHSAEWLALVSHARERVVAMFGDLESIGE